MAEWYIALDDSLVTAGTRESDAPVIRQWITAITHGGQGVSRAYANALAVTERASGQNMSVDVDTGGAIVGNGTDNVWYANDATVNLALSAADPTNGRIDVVVVHLDLTQASGSDTCQLAIVEGTPSGSPAVPSLTQTATEYELPIAYITVAANETDIADADIEDVRQYMYDHRVTRLVQPTQQTTGSVTLTDLAPFEFYAPASTWWRVQAYLPYDTNSANVANGLKFDFDFAGAGTYEANAWHVDQGAAEDAYTQTEAAIQDLAVGQEADGVLIIDAHINVTTAGKVKFQWAQYTGGTGTSKLGPYCIFEYQETT